MWRVLDQVDELDGWREPGALDNREARKTQKKRAGQGERPVDILRGLKTTFEVPPVTGRWDNPFQVFVCGGGRAEKTLPADGKLVGPKRMVLHYETKNFPVKVPLAGDTAGSSIQAGSRAQNAEPATATRPKRAGARSRERIKSILAQPEMLSSDEIGQRMDLSREIVNQRRRDGKLLALQGAKRGFRYPEWQLEPETGKPLEGLDRLIAACNQDHWRAHRILLAHHGEVDGMTGLDALRAGRIEDLLQVVHNMEAGVFA